MLLAFFTMTIDHIGMIFFPDVEWWRMVGRIAFPLFAWGVVRWFRLTKNPSKYKKRILILALISQLPIFFIFPDQFFFNICFTLFFGLIALDVLHNEAIQGYKKIWMIAWLSILAFLCNFDYGAYGVLTIVLLDIFWQQKKALLFFTFLTVIFYNINFQSLQWVYHIQIYAPIAILILYFTPIQKYDFKLNFYFKYGYYPIHLTILYLLFFFKII